MAITIVSDVMDFVTTCIDTLIGQNVAAIMGAIAPFFFACLSLYIAYRVFQYLYEPPEIPIMDVVKMAGSLGIVTAFAFSSGYYMQYVVPFVLGAGDDIAKSVSGHSSVANQLDGMITKIVTFINAQWTQLPNLFVSPTSFLYGLFTIVVVLIGSTPFIVISFSYLMISKVMVALLLSVGPIFIAFAFFPSTRDNFKQWTGQCLNYIVMIILYSIAFALELGLIAKFAPIDPSPGVQISFESSLTLAIVMLVFVAVTKEIPTLASQLAGGVGISGLAGGMVGGAFAGAAGGAFAAMGGKAALGGLGRNRNAAATWAAGKIGSGAKSAWDRMNSKGKIKP